MTDENRSPAVPTSRCRRPPQLLARRLHARGRRNVLGDAQAQQASPAPGAAAVVPGLHRARIPTSGGVTINAVKGGSGPPLLLLHGAPLTHLHVARRRARARRETSRSSPADLRGYGDSSQPQGLPDHSNYSKRAMAQDQVDVMKHFGFERFAVVGQDRGGRVAHRMALDHPDAVTKAVFIDIVPTYYLYTHVTIDFVQAYFHWFNYLQPSPDPRTSCSRSAPRRPGGELTAAQAEYQRTNGTPEGVHAMCEDYRAGASIDLQHDAADLDRRIRCPLHVLWAATARWTGSTTCSRSGASARAPSRARACRAATTCRKARRTRCSRSSGHTFAPSRVRVAQKT